MSKGGPNGSEMPRGLVGGEGLDWFGSGSGGRVGAAVDGASESAVRQRFVVGFSEEGAECEGSWKSRDSGSGFVEARWARRRRAFMARLRTLVLRKECLPLPQKEIKRSQSEKEETQVFPKIKEKSHQSPSPVQEKLEVESVLW